MSNNKIKPFVPPPDVPIVGEPFRVRAFIVNLVLECRCGGKLTDVVVSGINGAAPCPSCGKMYFFAELLYSRQQSKMHVNIGYSLPARKDEHVEEN